MQDVFAFFVSKINVGHAHIAAQGSIGDASVAVRMLPCPTSGAFFAFGDTSVGERLGIDKRDVSFIGFWLLINKLKHS